MRMNNHGLIYLRLPINVSVGGFSLNLYTESR